MNTGEQALKNLKEVAKQLGRPAHRVIHLCETGVVEPTQDADGRGSVRRFSREDIYRLLLALELQEAGVQTPVIKPFMRHLDDFRDLYRQHARDREVYAFDLVEVIRAAGSAKRPVRAYLKPPNQVALVVPGFEATSERSPRLSICPSESRLPEWKVSIAVNLTSIAAEL